VTDRAPTYPMVLDELLPAARHRIMGHAFVWNIRRSHYELAVEEPASRRLAVAFAEPALVLWDRIRERRAPARLAITQVTDPSEVHSMG
jgi:hypothetical protein